MQRPKPDQPAARHAPQASHWSRLWSFIARDRPSGISLANGRFCELVPFGGLRGLLVGTDRLFQHPVLVRSMQISGLQDATQFHFESRLVAEIRSVFVPRMITLGLHGNRPYHVLRLPSRIRPLVPDKLKARDAPGLVRQLAQALSSLHEQGVALRNLRPEAFALGAEGELLLIDFSAARRFGADRQVSSLTRVRELGEYDAPEAGSERYDAVRADAFGLGVLARRLLGERGLSASLRGLLAPDPRGRPQSLRPLVLELGGTRRKP